MPNVHGQFKVAERGYLIYFDLTARLQDQHVASVWAILRQFGYGDVCNELALGG